VAGVEEITTRDPNCPAGAHQQFQFKPVVWEAGQAHLLPTYSGDLDGMALAINENGEVVGASGGCTTFNPIDQNYLLPLHALLWEGSVAVDLGNLGGTGHGNGIQASNLNNKDQIIGFSDVKGDANFHAFLWTPENGMGDLGTLPGDANSQAIGINEAGDIVGVSLDANFNPRAFFLRKGTMTDMNTLVPAGSSLYLITGCSINSSEEIIGIGVDSMGNFHGYLATPVQGDSGSPSTAARPMVLPEAVRETMRGRFRMPGR
jgi:probable HAF family extracellular repeat protein